MGKRDKRRVYDKYKRTTAGGLILKLLCPNIGELLTALEQNLSDYETIEVGEWTGDWYHIVVIDSRYPSFPASAMIGFSVNVKRDIIMWNDDTSDNLSGGGCFLRSIKWKRFVNQRWSYAITDEKMNFYKYHNPPKTA